MVIVLAEAKALISDWVKLPLLLESPYTNWLKKYTLWSENSLSVSLPAEANNLNLISSLLFGGNNIALLFVPVEKLELNGNISEPLVTPSITEIIFGAPSDAPLCPSGGPLL